MTIALYLSGGADNDLGALSLGGLKSSVAARKRLVSVTAEQYAAGVVLYRCLYVSVTAAETDVRAWIGSETPLTQTTVALGWGAAALDTYEQFIVDDITPPVDVTFASPHSAGAASSGGVFAPGQFRALWLRYTVTPTAAPLLEQFTLVLGSGGGVVASASFNFSIGLNSQYIGLL